MIDRPLTAITAADLQRLVDEGAAEGRTLEFKRDLPGAKESDRKEFLADVSSFANALGGDLVYGIEEKGGRAVNADGLSVSNIDSEILRLDEMIRTGISPRLVGCHVQPVTGLPKGPAIVIRIPRSWQGPHIVSYQQEFRFYSRSTNGKFRMDATNVRDAVLGTGSIEDRIRTFRADRVAKIAAGETPVQLNGARILCAHAVPFQAVSGAFAIDLHAAARHTDVLAPWCGRTYSSAEYNLDGVYTYVPSSDQTMTRAYVQLFRNGALEATETSMLRPRPESPNGSIPSLTVAHELIAFIKRAMELYARLEVPPPIIIAISLLGARGVVLGLGDSFWTDVYARPLDRDVVLLPDATIEDSSADAPSIARPILDALYQASGIPRCVDYDEGGRWKPRR